MSKPLTDDQLAVAIPKAFKELFPDAWNHNWEYDNGVPKDCKKCEMNVWKWYDDPENNPCTVPDPIKINWDNAYKLARSVGPLVFMAELTHIWQNCPVLNYKEQWLAIYVTPADYIEAAIRAKENDNE